VNTEKILVYAARGQVVLDVFELIKRTILAGTVGPVVPVNVRVVVVVTATASTIWC
jgi:hypothetical protein